MLVLTLREGDDFYVGAWHILVGHIRDNGDTEIMIGSDKVIAVPLKRRYSLAPGQYITPLSIKSVADKPDLDGVQIGIEAPDSVLILSGRNYRKRKISDALAA